LNLVVKPESLTPGSLSFGLGWRPFINTGLEAGDPASQSHKAVSTAFLIHPT